MARDYRFPSASDAKQGDTVMAAMPEQSIKRTIRRGELRQIVPLADSTIYEMEQRGEFPRRFALTTRCVVWDLSEV
jgi:predicted DNA-binding transcriptional regulator AlpA